MAKAASGSSKREAKPASGSSKREAKPVSEDEKKQARRIVSLLKKEYPDAQCSLNHSNPLELLVATILSAQSTDARVNIVTPELFQKYRSAADFANADQADLENEIHSTGFFRNKTKAIIGAGKMLVAEYGGEVPADMEKLLALPGVARKTANVVLGNAFGVAEGIVVDTHVGRLSTRLGFTQEKQPEKIEQDLIALIPKKDWVDFSHLLIYHGRKICKAPTPLCEKCVVEKLCPSSRLRKEEPTAKK